MIAILIEDLAVRLGWSIDANVSTEAAALRVLARLTPSLAILDIQLASGTSYAIAELCRMRDVPVVFMTGLTARDIAAECQDAPILAKPFSTRDFEVALRRGREAPLPAAE
jgi:CheY-like chemotaxis protein